MPTVRPTTAKAPQTPARKPVKPATGRKVAPAKKPPVGKDQLSVSKPPAPKPPAPKPPAPPPPPPKPPVAETQEQAIAMALRGEPVLMPIDKKDPRALVIKAIDDEGGLQRFDVQLGEERFNLTLTADQPVEPGLTHVIPMVIRVPDEIRKTILAVNVLDAKSESAHYKIALTDLGGQPGTAEIRRLGLSEGKAHFAVTVGANTLDFKTPPENDLAWGVSKVAVLYAQVPEHLRRVLKTVVVDNGPNPLDEYWSKTYNMPNFSSAASAANGTATFWNGHRNLWDDTFHHEFGHLMGQLFSTKNNYVPDDWADAAKADGGEVTNYAKASPDEDFAESWWVYLRLKTGKPAYHARMTTLEDFRTKFPNRVKILDEIYNGERKPGERPVYRPAAASVGPAPLIHDHDEDDHLDDAA